MKLIIEKKNIIADDQQHILVSFGTENFYYDFLESKDKEIRTEVLLSN